MCKMKLERCRDYTRTYVRVLSRIRVGILVSSTRKLDRWTRCRTRLDPIEEIFSNTKDKIKKSTSTYEYVDDNNNEEAV